MYHYVKKFYIHTSTRIIKELSMFINHVPLVKKFDIHTSTRIIKELSMFINHVPLCKKVLYTYIDKNNKRALNVYQSCTTCKEV